MLFPWDRSDFYILPCAAKLLWIYLVDHGLNEMSSVFIQNGQLETLLGADYVSSIAQLRDSSFIKVKTVTDGEHGFKFVSQIELGNKYEIPLKDGTVFVVTEDIIRKLATDFPQVDVHTKLKEIIRWNVRNATHRKTLRGIMKHIEFCFSNTKTYGLPASSSTADNSAGVVPTQAIRAAESAVEHQRRVVNRPSRDSVAKFRASVQEQCKGL